MSACNCCERPIANLKALQASKVAGVERTTESSISELYATARSRVSSLPYSDFSLVYSVFAPSLGFKNSDAGGPMASVYWQKIKFIYYSASCYMKIYWDEVVRQLNPLTGNYEITGSEAKFIIVAPTVIEGICLPDGWKADDPLSWDATDEMEFPDIEPPDPLDGYLLSGTSKGIENLRWSCLADYTPPEDGTANGYPS